MTKQTNTDGRQYAIALSPDKEHEYMIMLGKDKTARYMKTGDTTPQVRRLRDCPKWIREIIKNELIEVAS